MPQHLHTDHLAGKVVVVTGSNSGIGWEAARCLANAGARTILACRDAKRAEAAAEGIRRVTPNANVETMSLDLASLASVRSFAQSFRSSASRLDLLINNAGVMALPRYTTADGFEMQFGTNFLGHFALTGLLIDLLNATPGSRVISLSSMVHWFGRIDFDDLQGVKRYGRWRAYCQSKLANLIFMLELQRRLAASGASTLSVGAHPGYAATNLQAVAPAMRGASFSGLIYNVGNRFFAQSAWRGALPTLAAAMRPELSGGEYFGPRFGLWGLAAHANISSRAKDEAVAKRLWAVSEELTNVRYAPVSG